MLDSPRLMPSPNLPQPMDQPIPMPSNQEFRPMLGPISTHYDEPTTESPSPNLAPHSISPLPSTPNTQPNITIPTTGQPTNNPPAITGTTSDPQRSFMSIGFKLKKLIKDLDELNANNLDLGASKAAINLQNAIDETRSVWTLKNLHCSWTLKRRNLNTVSSRIS